MGDKPIQPVIQAMTIDTMLNWIMEQYFKVKYRAEFLYVWTRPYIGATPDDFLVASIPVLV